LGEEKRTRKNSESDKGQAQKVKKSRSEGRKSKNRSTKKIHVNRGGGLNGRNESSRCMSRMAAGRRGNPGGPGGTKKSSTLKKTQIVGKELLGGKKKRYPKEHKQK